MKHDIEQEYLEKMIYQQRIEKSFHHLTNRNKWRLLLTVITLSKEEVPHLQAQNGIINLRV